MNLDRRSERRISPRIPTKLFVRGLGDDRGISEELGDFSIGGVGFLLPSEPRVERFRVSFATPSSAKLHTATCQVVGASELDQGVFVHLKFLELGYLRKEAVTRLIREGLSDLERPVVSRRASARSIPVAPKVWMSKKEIPIFGSAKEESGRLTRWILRLLAGEGFSAPEARRGGRVSSFCAPRR
ncbi:MAG: PilZ domain-containing protein [Deltaproteobacteria bacterium]|nr:PilZ domain-containing protein [Deltaproteobacteria bacterium]